MSSSDGREELLDGETDGHDFGSVESISVVDGVVGWLVVYGERAGNTLVVSSAYLAFVAMTEVAIVMAVLALPPSPAPVVGALVTFTIYTNDHLADDPAESPRAAFVDRYRGELYGLAALAYGLAVAIAVLGGPLALLLTLLPGVFWILYASGRIPGLGLKIRRLKQTLVLNSTIVALAWAISLTFLPLSFADGTVTGGVVLVFAYFFLRSFSDTVIPNVRDRAADRAAGVATIPVVFGLARTRWTLYGIDLLTAAVVGYAAFAGLVPVPIATALLVGVVYSIGVATSVGRAGDDELRAIAAEFEYVVVGLALLPVVYGP